MPRIAGHPEVPDATGTRDFVYDHEQLSGEGLDPAWYGGLMVTNLYDKTGTRDTGNNLVPGRYAGVELGVKDDLQREMKQAVTYDDFGRINTLTLSYAAQGTRSALSVAGTYGYEPNSALWNKFTQGNFTASRTWEAGRNVVGTASASWNSTVLTQHTYTVDDAGRCTDAVQQGSVFSSGATNGYGDATRFSFQYNEANELEHADGYLGAALNDTSRPMGGRSLAYSYDSAGNRKTVSVDSEQVAYSDGAGNTGANALNQVKERGTLKTHVSGTAAANTTVTVDYSIPAARQGRYWDAVLAGFGQVLSTSVMASADGKAESRPVSALLAPATQTFTYDADGNLKSDWQWDYVWDAENRLLQMSTNAALQAWGMPARTIWFTYDYLGRRVQKQDSLGVNTKYVYHDWNLLAEIDATSHKVTRSYGWGIEAGGDLTGTGAPGSLILETVHTAASLTAYHVASDGHGNVAALIRTTTKADGSTVNGAVYEYDPYGLLLRKTGDEANNNPFQYSTRYTDQETGLVYYGFRYYSPSLGRFINRDPIEEAGGANLYAFVGNKPVGGWDRLGLTTEDGAEINGGTDANPVTMFWWSDGPNGAAYYNKDEFYGDYSASREEFSIETWTNTTDEFDDVATSGADGQIQAPNSVDSTALQAIIDSGAGQYAQSATPNGRTAVRAPTPAEVEIGLMRAVGRERDPVRRARLESELEVYRQREGIRPPGSPRDVTISATTPVGRSGSPINVVPPSNSPTIINGLRYSGHALDQMQGRGFVPSVVEDTLMTGVPSPGNTPGTTVYFNLTNNVRVVINNNSGNIITVIPGGP